MQIVCVIALYPPKWRVGAWLVTHKWLRGLVDAGHDVTVLAHMERAGERTLDGVRIFGGTSHLAACGTADMVITNASDNTPFADSAHNTTYDRGAPTVVMAHGHIDDPACHARYQHRPPAVTITCSDATAADVTWPGPTATVYPPIFADEHACTPGNAVTLVNLSADKGGHVFWTLARCMPDVNFLGVYGHYGVQVRGWNFNTQTIMPVTDMRQIWRRTRVLLMPSRREWFGCVGIEAMCAGIPVIAHPTPGLQESLGDAGIFVDRDDTTGWKAAIQRVRRDDVWPALSDAAKARAATFDPDVQVAKFVDIVTTTRARH